MNSEYKELEYKYKADNVGLQDFLKLMKTYNIKKTLDISSWDIYYLANEDNFVRYRQSDTPELTKKVKTKAANNWERVEIDLPLDPNRIKEETVSRFLALDGYKENFRVYKSCFIFWLNDVNYVYYIVYNPDMKEVGRFVEVEVNKTSTVQDLDSLLKQAEAGLAILGITPQHRMKKSLFELYKR